MRIYVSKNASATEVAQIIEVAHAQAGDPNLVRVEVFEGSLVVKISVLGHPLDVRAFEKLEGVDRIEGEPIYSLASGVQSRAIVEIPFVGASFGTSQFVVMAGPCAVEKEEDLFRVAREAKRLGAKILRGGAFKPRTSPYSFQGLGLEGLELLKRVRDEIGIGIVTEAMEPATVEEVSQVADIVQVGSRNMQNYPLLKAVGRQPKPVLLKRGMSATLEEWLGSAEYILAEGNPNVILCERGIRTFSRHSRHTLDIGVIPAVRERSNLPIVVDPSHATGLSTRVPPMALSALAGGADGILIEVHPNPEGALADGFQSLNLKEFEELMGKLREVASALGRVI